MQKKHSHRRIRQRLKTELKSGVPDKGYRFVMFCEGGYYEKNCNISQGEQGSV